MITANWRIQCNVECPYCDNYIDLCSEINDSFEWLPSPGHTEDMDVEITCPKCKSDFNLQKIEY